MVNEMPNAKIDSCGIEEVEWVCSNSVSLTIKTKGIV
tara:strand:+ start:432 stop:542 length:111 start_codon:yes stop_codon:yes gene_type:complete